MCEGTFGPGTFRPEVGQFVHRHFIRDILFGTFRPDYCLLFHDSSRKHKKIRDFFVWSVRTDQTLRIPLGPAAGWWRHPAHFMSTPKR